MLSGNNKIENLNIKYLKPLLSDIGKIETSLNELQPNQNQKLSDLAYDSDETDITKFLDTAKEVMSEFIKKHREIHTPISKCGRTTERIFHEKIDHLNNYFKIDSAEYKETYNRALNSLIFDYFLRVGLVDVAAVFLKEDGVNFSNNEREILSEASIVINSMKINKFDDLKNWLNINKEKLSESQQIKFYYIISKLEFLCVLSNTPNDYDMLIERARKMSTYARFFQPDFEYLMGSLAFIHDAARRNQFYWELFNMKQSSSSTSDNLNDQMDCEESINDEIYSTSPTSSITKNITQSIYYNYYLTELISMFSQQISTIKLANSTDPLLTLFNSGMDNITMFYNHDQIKQKLNLNTLSNDTVDFPLRVRSGAKEQYHTIFHCPIDKTIVSGPNSIVRLKCGHAISKIAYKTLTKDETKPKIKCPYCPSETKVREELLLIF